MLTDQEKWYFDHHGFIILPQVILGGDIEWMLELGDRWHGMPLEDLPHPLTSTADTHPDYSPTIARWINHIQYSDPVFQRLALNPEIMRVIISLTHSYPVLVDTALTKNHRTSDDIHFHASDQEYEIIDDKPFAGFLNAAISLVDVPKGTGFVCLPGSHKANFHCPKDITTWEAHQEVVHQVSLKAGDMVIFSENTLHGSLPWQAKYERRALLYRYTPKYLHYDGGTYNVTQPDWVTELTEAQQAVLEPPYIYHHPLIEADGETVVRPRRED